MRPRRWRLRLPRDPPDRPLRGRGPRRHPAGTPGAAGGRRVAVGPVRGRDRPEVVAAADVVVNVAGSPTAGNPHSDEVGAATAREPGRPRPGVLAEAIAETGGGSRRSSRATAVAFYGDHGDEVVTEAIRQPRRRPDDRGDPRLAGRRRARRGGGRAGLRAAHRTRDGPAPTRRGSAAAAVQARARGPARRRLASTSRWSRSGTGSARVAHLAGDHDARGAVQPLLPGHADQRASSPRRSPRLVRRPAFLAAPAGAAPVAGGDGARAAGLGQRSAPQRCSTAATSSTTAT